jgi:transketolase
MSDLPYDSLVESARIIRGLSVDAIQKANSGHPGLPLGCAEIGASLYGFLLNHDPGCPSWPNRDRFILSAGHGSMLLYSCLHLSGYSLSLEDLKNFRQWGSRTPGHPEFRHTEGVECTTGPLGQGIANGVGMALGARIKADRYNTKDHPLIDHQVVVLCGDGCLMEGISYEALSLAGHLSLDNFILIYDSNDISLDAPTRVSFTENMEERFTSMGFHVVTVDGHDIQAFAGAYQEARLREASPTVIVAKTIIGKGSPNKAGTQKCHGAPLGEEEVKLLKEGISLPEEPFYVSETVKDFFRKQAAVGCEKREAWEALFRDWKENHPALYSRWCSDHDFQVPADLHDTLPDFETGQSLATRKSSQIILQELARKIPHLIGGSADLSCSNLSRLEAYDDIQKKAFAGRNIFFGVREHAMGAIVNGLSYYGGFLPFCATFLVFADYLRPAIRLAALTNRKVFYVLTHDSFMVGEDGPTHQPVETIASLRAIPGLTTYRPADANEVKAAYVDALSVKGPVAFCLTRQNVETLETTAEHAREGVSRGAYVVKQETLPELQHVIFASGSEVALAIGVADEIEKRGQGCRVISVPSFEKFFQSPLSYQNKILSVNAKKRWALEAQVPFGWHRFVGLQGEVIAMEGFGSSAPGKILQEQYGFTVAKVLERICGQEADVASKS